MKKLPVMILILLPLSLHASVGGDIWCGFMLNYPAYSSVLTPVTRLRLSANLVTPVSGLSFDFRGSFTYGNLHQGSTLLMTPANNAVVTNSGIAIDVARVSYTVNYFNMTAGIVDPADYDSESRGFYSQTLACTNEMGFLSSHFSRLLAQTGRTSIATGACPRS